MRMNVRYRSVSKSPVWKGLMKSSVFLCICLVFLVNYTSTVGARITTKNHQKECRFNICKENEECIVTSLLIRVCRCRLGYIRTSTGCKECNCGPHGRCSFINGVEQCHCDSNYVWDVEGSRKCVPCDCGYHGSCVIKSSRKWCHCEDGFLWDKTPSGICAECNCGPHGRCSSRNGTKQCQCDPNYVWDAEGSNKCVLCDCGPHGSCEFQHGAKKCHCESGYIWNVDGNGICQSCDCGPHGTCDFTTGYKRCTCSSGYVWDGTRNGLCEETEPQQSLIGRILIVGVIVILVFIICVLATGYQRLKEMLYYVYRRPIFEPRKPKQEVKKKETHDTKC